MDQSRYRDKSYLVTYELTTDIFEEFGVKADEIVPIRAVYIIYTDNGLKILKKVNYSYEELQFIKSVMDYVNSKGNIFVVPFMKTINGEYYVKREDDIYVMLDLMEGRAAEDVNVGDIAIISKSLCSFHKSTSGIENIIDRKDNLYKWIPTFKRRLNELLKFKEIAQLHEIKSDFDNIFLDNIKKHYEQAEKSINLLEISEYEKLCDEARSNKKICIHDLAYHNILIDNMSSVHFIDFDNCIFDLRIHDIANFIINSIKYFNWDIERAKIIISNYCSIDALDNNEFEVLYNFMMFPQDFYEISKKYYMKTKKWDEDYFALRLESKAGYYDDRLKFLNSFKDLL